MEISKEVRSDLHRLLQGELSGKEKMDLAELTMCLEPDFFHGRPDALEGLYLLEEIFDGQKLISHSETLTLLSEQIREYDRRLRHYLKRIAEARKEEWMREVEDAYFRKLPLKWQEVVEVIYGGISSSREEEKT